MNCLPLTQPNGKTVYVVAEQIIAVREADPDEHPNSCSVITTQAGEFAVAETPSSIAYYIGLAGKTS